VNVFRFGSAGKVVEIWNHRDDLGLMEQLGASVFAGVVPSGSSERAPSFVRTSPSDIPEHSRRLEACPRGDAHARAVAELPPPTRFMRALRWVRAMRELTVGGWSSRVAGRAGSPRHRVQSPE
jgi:hypothetical protein